MVEIEISNPNHLTKPSLTYLNIIGPSAPDPNPVEHFWKKHTTEDGGRTDGRSDFVTSWAAVAAKNKMSIFNILNFNYGRNWNI